MALDPIEDHLIAGIHVLKLVQENSVLKRWDFMAPLMYLVGNLRPEEVRPKPEKVTHVSIAPWFLNKIEELIQKRLLLQYNGENIKALCGLFGVPKPSRLLRVIFNAIPANQTLKPLQGELRFFTLDELARAYVCLFRKGKVVYVLNIDYRHYYYQIPLPPAFWEYFCVNFKGRWYRPGAMPMGYRDACLLSQVLTLAILLLRVNDEEDQLGVDLDGAVMPGIPLISKKGKTSSLGAAFVLLDDILIITHDKNFLEAWHARLKRNEKLANLERKVTHTVRLTEGTRICTTCKETTAKCTTFAGVELCPASRCEPASDDLLVLPPKPTWREVAGALGSMLWQIRVKTAGIPARLSQQSLLHAESILQVWTEVGKRAPLEGWDTVASSLNRASLAISRR
jgi:hypothetical protein